MKTPFACGFHSLNNLQASLQHNIFNKMLDSETATTVKNLKLLCNLLFLSLGI